MTQPPDRALRLLAADGVAGAGLPVHDWSSTPVGPPSRWPPLLLGSVRVALASPMPAFIWWGPELVTLYNAAAIPILGERHPGALGRPAAQALGEAWDALAADVERVRRHGRAASTNRLPIARAGEAGVEEAYFTLEHGPILDDHQQTVGVFSACVDETARVVGERRLRTLREVAARAGGGSPARACEEAVAALARNPYDLPFVAIYLAVDARAELRLIAGAGVSAGDPGWPPVLPLHQPGERPWPVDEILAAPGPLVIGDLAARGVTLQPGPWPELPSAALACPIPGADSTRPAGCLIAGVSPRRPLDEDYRAFVALVSDQVGSAIARARRRKAARPSLRGTQVPEERLRQVLSAARMVVWEWDAATDRVETSSNLTDLLGVSDINRPEDVHRLLEPAVLERHLATVREALADRHGYESLIRFRRPDSGEVVWLQDRATAVLDAAGRLVGLSGIMSDVTERERGLEALRESEMRFRTMADHAPVLIWMSDPDGRCLWFNQPWLAFVGRTMEQELDAGWTDNVHPDDRAQTLRTMREQIAEGQGFSVEYRLRRHDGAYRWVLASGVPMRAGEALVGYVGSSVDITGMKESERSREWLLQAEQQARQEAERASRLKDEFLTTLSHELRTPLNAMLGWARLAHAGRVPASEMPRAIGTILRNAQAQAQLVGDILDVSRIVTGRLRLDVRPLDLVDVIDAAVDAVRPAAEARGVQLHVSAARAPEILVGDPERLQQVIWNLLSNAVKFTPEGGRVDLVSQRVGAHIDVTVTDSGIGIAPDFIPHVFERFRQADASASRAYGGLGLGLALVKHIVEAHGGSVSAASPGPGRGASFTVRLPASEGGQAGPPDAAAQAAAPMPEDLTAGVLAGVRVLAVDDERESLQLIASALGRHGATVAMAGSAVQALEAFERSTPDVLLAGAGGAGSDGWTVIDAVRTRPPAQGGQVPAAALLASSRPADRVRALRAGFQLHLTKPIDEPELVAAVRALASREDG